MRHLFICAISLIAIIEPAVAKEMQAPTHVMTTPMEIKWGAPPPVFEKGASFTVLSGDPGKAGIFVARLKMPAGYKILPHWHPTDEQVTVISGEFALGMGDKFNKAAVKVLPVGGYAFLPAEMHHFALSKTEAIVQVEGMGPFALNYINSSDDPTKRTVAK